jgi:hypothetical protein
MVTTILSHEVKNYADWRKVFDSHAEDRSRMNVSISGVYQSADNPNKVTVITKVPSMEVIHSFLSNPDVKATMEKGGVIGMPEVKILHEV